MIEIRLGDEDLARTRFAYSPSWELIASFRVLANPTEHPLHSAWVAEARAALRDLDLAPLRAVVRPVGYVPDFLLPPPVTPLPTFESEIEVIKATPPEIVRRELGWVLAETPGDAPLLRRYLDAPEVAVAELCAVVEAYWQRCLQQRWSRLFTLLESDVLFRSSTLALYGPEEVFKDLHPAVSYRSGVIYIEKPNDELVIPGGRGLLLIPVIFAWPQVYVTADLPWQPTIAYSPRGAANLWLHKPPTPAQALSELVGVGRAMVLEQLTTPRTTGDLAQLLSMTPGAVSQHLARLRQIGMVESLRMGTRVYHRLTTTGDALLKLFAHPT